MKNIIIQVCLFINLSLFAGVERVYVGELQEEWREPSDHLPIAVTVDEGSFAYSITSWKKKDFWLFHPLCFPFIFFLIYYGIPSLILPFVFEQDIYPNALYIQIAGTISYFAGVGLYTLTRKNHK